MLSSAGRSRRPAVDNFRIARRPGAKMLRCHWRLQYPPLPRRWSPSACASGCAPSGPTRPAIPSSPRTSRAARSAATTTSRWHADSLPVDDESACVREVLASVAGYGPLQPYLDDPTVEELWINAPDRIFIARAGVSERVPLDAHRHRGPRSRRADAALLRSPGRSQSAVRRRVAAGRQPPPRRHPRHHPSALGRERPEVPAGVPRPRPARRERIASRRRAATLLRDAMARRQEHPGLRCHACRQDDSARRAHRGVPAAITASSRSRRRSSSPSTRPTSSRCRDGSRASRAPARSRSAAS